MTEEERNKAKERMRRYRERLKTVTVPPDVLRFSVGPEEITVPLSVTPNVTPADHLKAYISTPCPGMPRLERLQRIAGALGKHASSVWFGSYTMEEIGKCIGTLPAVYRRGD